MSVDDDLDEFFFLAGIPDMREYEVNGYIDVIFAKVDDDDDINQHFVVRIDDEAIKSAMSWAFGEPGDLIREQYPGHFYEETISYWCDRIEADRGDSPAFHNEDGDVYFDLYTHLQRGGELRLHDAVDNVWYKLTKIQIVYGIRQALNECYHDADYDLENLVESGLIVWDEVEEVYVLDYPERISYSYVGDMMIQLAIFDDVKYSRESVRKLGAIMVHLPYFRPHANY